MHVVIFEGQYWTTFAPVCLNRPVFMLSTGMSTLLDKQIRYLGATRLTFWVRPDLISWNEESLIEDAIQLLRGVRRPIVAGPFYTVNDDDIWLGNEVTVQPGCVLDASLGPVVLAEGVKIGANSVIQGPCYIGPHCQIRPLSIVKESTTLGRLCKIGGEVVNT